MRLVVARCEVEYTGRLNAFLPESTRLLMVKADGSVLVHADAGGYKPLKGGSHTPPTNQTKKNSGPSAPLGAGQRGREQKPASAGNPRRSRGRANAGPYRPAQYGE